MLPTVTWEITIGGSAFQHIPALGAALLALATLEASFALRRIHCLAAVMVADPAGAMRVALLCVAGHRL